MTIRDVVSLLGALSVFLFGMDTMTGGLEKLASGKLASLLEKLTDNILMGVLLGAVVAGVVHSSAATTVMCIGFVNAGILQLRQAVGVIMGANIGTTLTAQILRLGDLSSDNIVLSLLKPDMLGPILAFTGIVFFLFITSGRKKIVGQIFLGLGLLFIGIQSMETALLPLTEAESFRMLFVRFSNPVLGIAVGAMITALIQSSTASVGILQALAANGMVTFSTAAPIIMGQNIGTCITAIISSIGATRNAKRTAAVHLYFNLIGTAVFLIVLYGAHAVFGLSFWDSIMDRGAIANLHSLFNFSCTLLLLPFNGLLVKLVKLTFPDTGNGREAMSTVLDHRFLSTPSVALERARTVANEMADLARKNFQIATELLENYNPKLLVQMEENENQLDFMEGALSNYLVQLSSHSLDSRQSDLVSDLLYALSDFERIGDYSMNLSETAEALNDGGLSYSPEATVELKQLIVVVQEAINTVVTSYQNRTPGVAFQVEPLEQVVDLIVASMRERHMERLKAGACNADAGALFMELLIHLERISDHCSNAALRILHECSHQDSLVHQDPHAYINQLHRGVSPEFETLFSENRKKYYEPLFSESSKAMPALCSKS